MFTTFRICSKIIPLAYNQTLVSIPKRTFTNKIFRSNTVEKLKESDEIPAGYDLIYRTGLQRYVQYSHAFALVSTAVTVPMFLYTQYTTPMNVQFPNDSLVGEDIDLYIFGGGFLLFNLALILTSSKLCLRIYFNEEKQHYFAVLPTKLGPMKTRTIEFSVGGMEKTQSTIFSKLVPWSASKYKVGTEQVYLMENSFRTQADFELMLKKC